MADLPPEELQYFVEDKGHGCLDGCQVVREPEASASIVVPHERGPLDPWWYRAGHPGEGLATGPIQSLVR